MKLKKELTTSVIRNKYTVQFTEQVLQRIDRDGIPIVAVDLELSESMLYSCKKVSLYTQIEVANIVLLPIKSFLRNIN